MTAPVILLAALVSTPTPQDATGSFHIAVHIEGLDEIQWEDEARDTGLTPDRRRALRADVQREVERTFTSGGIAIRLRGRPLFVVGVRTSRADNDGEWVVEVATGLYEATPVGRSGQRCLPALSGRAVTKPVATDRIEREVLTLAVGAAERAKAHLQQRAGQQGIRADGHAPR